MPKLTDEIRLALGGTPHAANQQVPIPVAAPEPQKDSTMPLPAEAQTLLISAINSPAAQTALLDTITSGETPLETMADSFIAGLKGNGLLGVFIDATKGTVESEVNAGFKSLPPATIAAYITAGAISVVKDL